VPVRHPSLVKLSRDHHRALVLAARMRRSSANDAGELATQFLAFLDEADAVHFTEEERFVLPLLAQHLGSAHPLIARTACEHAELRARAKSWGEGGCERVTPEAVRATGELLHDHVRMEERELFPLVEAHATAEQLAALQTQLES
jgi:hemerythrin-like domain-containing protein